MEVPDWYCWCCHIKVTSFWFSQVTMSVVKSIVDLWTRDKCPSPKVGQLSYWQTRESLASPVSTQHHLSGGVYRGRLREVGFPAWEEKAAGRCHLRRVLRRGVWLSRLRWEQRLLPGRGIRASRFHGKMSPAPGSRRQRRGGTGGGWCSNGPATALGAEAGCRLPGLHRLSAEICHSSRVAWWAHLGLGPDFSCVRFGNEVKIRLNLHKNCEVSGEVFCCLILQKQDGNCTPGSCCEIAATDNQKWDRFFFFTWTLGCLKCRYLFFFTQFLFVSSSVKDSMVLGFANTHSHAFTTYWRQSEHWFSLSDFWFTVNGEWVH